MATRIFKERSGAIANSLALLYVALGYTGGLVALFSGQVPLVILGILLLGHAMTIAAYLLHECAHNTVFVENKNNARLGTVLTWVTGSCYGTYENIRFKHFRHHVENADIVWFDYYAWFLRHPVTLRLVQVLEFFYIPAHDLLMHGVMMIGAFVIPQRRAQRARNLAVIVLRVGVFGLVFWYFPVVALGYAIAYMLMMTVLRFMDALQHDYNGTTILFENKPGPHRGDRAYEQIHTFSNLLSLKYPWINLLVLNFGYHNAHHAKPTAPWYALPALHRDLFGDGPEAVILFWPQLKSFHQYRVSRVMADAPEANGPDFLRLAQTGEISGGNAASFLTAF
jgi:fatty acid desaturase